MSQRNFEALAWVAEIARRVGVVATKGQEILTPASETGKDQEKTKKTLGILTVCFDSWRSLRSLLEGASAEINFKDLVHAGHPSSRRPQDQEPAIQEEAVNLRAKAQEAADELAEKITQLLSFSSLTPHLKESLPDSQIETPEDIETILRELVKPVIVALKDELYQQSHTTPRNAKPAQEILEEAAWQASGQGAALTEEQTVIRKERRANFEKLIRGLQYLSGVHNNPDSEAVNNAYTALLKGKGYSCKDISQLLDALQFYVATETDPEMAERVGRLEYNYTAEDLTKLKKQIKAVELININSLVSLPKEEIIAKKAKAKEAKAKEGVSFNYDKAEAKRLGLERLEIKGYPKADVLIRQFTVKIKPLLKALESATDKDEKKRLQEQFEAEKTAFVAAWQKDCPGLPMPCVPGRNDWWYLIQLAKDRIIFSLTDNAKTVLPNFGRSEVILMDSWQEEDWHEEMPGTENEKMQKIISPLLQEFLGSGFEGVVNIKRDDLDALLWDGDPGDRIPTTKHKEVLEKLGLNPNEFEIRCIRQDEYARGAVLQGWGQKSTWTNFDHFFLGDDGDRNSLIGGSREHGGASDVWRGNASDYLAVRLVLSRKAV